MHALPRERRQFVLERGLVDKLAVFVAPVLAGGDGPVFLPPLGSPHPLLHPTVQMVGEDVLYQAYVHEP